MEEEELDAGLEKESAAIMFFFLGLTVLAGFVNESATIALRQ